MLLNAGSLALENGIVRRDEMIVLVLPFVQVKDGEQFC
jgi:hypothetical protein